jgi:hypothetical protein
VSKEVGTGRCILVILGRDSESLGIVEEEERGGEENYLFV